jgi:alpha-ribazole phosphatase/probable phosphoglycerate mutase
MDGVSGMTRFWLIRHGEPAEESRQRCYGSLDVGLSEAGRQQMASVAEFLQKEPVAAIYASPRRRAVESAQILAAVKGAPIEVVTDLSEINFGDFEGRPYDEIALRYPEAYRQWMERPTEVQFPNGENFAAMRTRVVRAFQKISSECEGQTVAVVSHGGVNRILIAQALQMPDNCIFRLAQDFAAMNLLVLFDDFPVLQLLNGHP